MRSISFSAVLPTRKPAIPPRDTVPITSKSGSSTSSSWESAMGPGSKTRGAALKQSNYTGADLTGADFVGLKLRKPRPHVHQHEA